MGEVITGVIPTTIPLDPDVLLEANKGKFQSVILIGYDHDDRMITCSSVAEISEINLLLDLAKHRILGHAIEQTE